MFIQKRIFLTGGTGFLGSHIASRLLRQGHTIIFLARANKNYLARERIEQTLRSWGIDSNFQQCIEVVVGDITENNLGITEPIAESRIDDVWHCAGSISFAEEEREQTHTTNVGGTVNLLKWCEDKPIKRLYYISTAYVCGDRKGEIFEDELDCGQGFCNPYEESKFMAEKILKEWASSFGVPTTIFRPTIVLGDSITAKTLSLAGYYRYMRGYEIIRKKAVAAINAQKENFSSENGLLRLPLRVVAAPVPVNMATVDYASGLIVALASETESMNKTFHVANPHPQDAQWWIEASARVLGITGLHFTSQSEFIKEYNPNGFLSRMERALYSAYEPYIPYVTYNRIFRMDNVREILGDIPPHPLVDEVLVETLLNFAFGHKQLVKL